MNPTNLNTTVCSYCGKVMIGGVTRAKEHLMAKKGNVAPCTKTPQNVREELWKLFKEKTTTSSINPTTNDIMRVKMKLKFLQTRVEILVEKKDQWICFLEIQVLQ